MLKLLTLAYSKSLCTGISLNCNKQYSRIVTVLLVQSTIRLIHQNHESVNKFGTNVFKLFKES